MKTPRCGRKLSFILYLLFITEIGILEEEFNYMVSSIATYLVDLLYLAI